MQNRCPRSIMGGSDSVSLNRLRVRYFCTLTGDVDAQLGLRNMPTSSI